MAGGAVAGGGGGGGGGLGGGGPGDGGGAGAATGSVNDDTPATLKIGASEFLVHVMPSSV